MVKINLLSQGDRKPSNFFNSLTGLQKLLLLSATVFVTLFVLIFFLIMNKALHKKDNINKPVRYTEQTSHSKKNRETDKAEVNKEQNTEQKIIIMNMDCNCKCTYKQ
ncbi:MAG: hypothetical protein AABW81_01505 [Nanoarchaeota archaeon]